MFLKKKWRLKMENAREYYDVASQHNRELSAVNARCALRLYMVHPSPTILTFANLMARQAHKRHETSHSWPYSVFSDAKEFSTLPARILSGDNAAVLWLFQGFQREAIALEDMCSRLRSENLWVPPECEHADLYDSFRSETLARIMWPEDTIIVFADHGGTKLEQVGVADLYYWMLDELDRRGWRGLSYVEHARHDHYVILICGMRRDIVWLGNSSKGDDEIVRAMRTGPETSLLKQIA